MGKFDEAGVVVGLGNDAGPGVDVGSASNAPSVVDSNVGSTVDATADTAAGTAGGLSTTGYILIGVGGLVLILVIAALLFLFFRARSEKQKNEAYKAMTEVDIAKDQIASSNLDISVEPQADNNDPDSSVKDQSGGSDISSNPQADSIDTDVPVPASNVQKPTIGNILVSNKEDDKVLVGKLRVIVTKINDGEQLDQADATIDANDINKIDSSIIKLHSTFGFCREDLADATRALLIELQNSDYNQNRVNEATKKFKKKAGIKNQTTVFVLPDSNPDPDPTILD